MIELLDPRKIEKVYPELWINAGWSYSLDYSWIIHNCFPRGANLVVDVGCGTSPLGPFVAKKIGAVYQGVDKIFGMDFIDYEPPRKADVILWASSLEHNTPEMMRKLYLRSIDMLAPGGVFLATITIAETTHWFQPAVNTNLSPIDAAKLFDERILIGDIHEVWKAYREDNQMMDLYRNRFGHFDDKDPLYIIAGVMRVKKW
jgi:SAM-dependent methyltransferase